MIKSPYYEIDNAYAYGFEDAKLKALDIVNKYLHSTFTMNEELLYKLKKDIERM